MTADREEDTPDILAAEYALRLLEGEALAQARARMRQDAAFRKTVAGWEMRLARLADQVDPVVPSAQTKEALLGRLFGYEVPVPLLQRVGFWKALALGAIAVAAMLMFAILTMPRAVLGPVYAGQIVSQEGDFRAVLTVDKDSDAVIVTVISGAAPQGRILEVWAHGPDKPAQSVGLWAAGDTIRLALPPEIAAVVGTLTLGISEEAPGGSVTGAPSGRVFGTVDILGVERVR